ncbi:hypothetical protein niasHS_012186 [Heterodera schachtii]|uniref:Peptidase S26 domain-containing protein n=1 Tax=Heterodera schachtii TaxID=97005 RepID=A0ABD2II03_HETSC
MRFLGTTLKIVGGLCVPLTFFDVIAYPTSVIGSSMEPTLLPGDFVLISRISVGSPSVGDIFCFCSPFDPKTTHIKRVAALGGQTAENKREQQVVVPLNHVWVHADNVTLTGVLDSRHYGEVNCGLLKGKAVCVIWPPKRWKSLGAS